MWPFRRDVKRTQSDVTTSIQDVWALLSGGSDFQTNLVNQPSIADLEVVYSQSSTVFACVNVIARTISKAEVKGGSLATRTLLAHPNQMQNWDAFIKSYVTYLMCTGVCYVAKFPVDGAVVDELQVLKSSGLLYSVGPFDEPMRSVYYADGYNHIKFPDPLNQLIISRYQSLYEWGRVSGPLASCWPEIKTDMARQKYQDETLEKLPALVAIAEINKPSSKLQRDQLQASIQDILGGGCLVLPDGVTVKTPGVITDIELGGIAQYAEARICSCLGTPPQIIGLKVGLEHQTFSNYKEARDSFISETVEPLLANMSDTFSRNLGEEIEFVLPEEVLTADNPISEGKTGQNIDTTQPVQGVK